MILENISSENKKILFIFILTILFSMLINVFHPYLWGPDEPRVAEIAREAFVSGNYITPHLCGRPFVEKPPLYFDMIAWSYAITGEATPGVARLISALMGCIMLGVAFWLGYCWGGLRRAALAVGLLIMMPQFYRTTHFIVSDIAVGAFCALALGLFMYYAYWSKDKNIKWPLYLFYLVSAAAFLSKGLVGIFHIGIVIGVFILLRRRWDLLKRMLSPLAMLVFLIPVAIWVYLFYREGGVYFLHEHFINNTIGRFLHIKFEMAGSQLAFTDIGNSSPWYFYLKRMPVMFGFSFVFLPLIFWDGLRKLNLLPRSWVVYGDDLKKSMQSWKTFVVALLLLILNGKKKELGDKQKDIVLILLLWTFLPIIVLSFSSIKEVTYILPSYVAIAIMLGGWLDERLNTAESLFKSLVLFALIVLPIVIASFTLAVLSVKIYLITVIVWMILCLILAIISIFKLRVVQATFIVFGMLLCMIIMINTPEVMLTTRLSRKCHIDLAKYVFDRVRDKQLFVYGGCETIRSSMPFYGKRPVPSIGGHAILKKLLSSGENNFVIIIDEHLKKMREDKELSRILDNCKIELLPFPNLSDEYSLISAPGAKR